PLLQRGALGLLAQREEEVGGAAQEQLEMVWWDRSKLARDRGARPRQHRAASVEVNALSKLRFILGAGLRKVFGGTMKRRALRQLSTLGMPLLLTALLSACGGGGGGGSGPTASPADASAKPLAGT